MPMPLRVSAVTFCAGVGNPMQISLPHRVNHGARMLYSNPEFLSGLLCQPCNSNANRVFIIWVWLQLELWREHAHKTLPVLMRATSMLVCGEDLGFLAPCVHPLMKELGLIGVPSRQFCVFCLPTHTAFAHACCMPDAMHDWILPKYCLGMAAKDSSIFLSCTHSRTRMLLGTSLEVCMALC